MVRHGLRKCQSQHDSKPFKPKLLDHPIVADHLAPAGEDQRQKAEQFGSAAVILGLVVGDAVNPGNRMQRAPLAEQFSTAADSLVAAKIGERRNGQCFSAPFRDERGESLMTDQLFYPVASSA